MEQSIARRRLKEYLEGTTVGRNWLVPLAVEVRRKIRYTRAELDNARLWYSTISKKEFINDLKTAIETRTGYAAAKTGISQKHWMYYEILLAKERNADERKSFERQLHYHCLNLEGIFPARLDFYLEFNRWYVEHVRKLDCLGIYYEWPPLQLDILKYYKFKTTKTIHYINQEPDRSSPSNEKNCYLQYFRNKKVLLICPYAELLRERATKDIFEGVWAKTRKKWFYPKQVDALEFPYGFTTDAQRRYPTVLQLFEDIKTEIDKRDFDIALVGAAGLAVPIVSHIKGMCKIAIDLGGHLQVLFGVMGERWRRREDWKKQYFNDYWIDMPARYRPKEIDAGIRGRDLDHYW